LPSQAEQNPLSSGESRVRLISPWLWRLHLTEAARVPKLVAKCAKLDVFLVEHDILAEWRAAHRAKANASAPYLAMRSRDRRVAKAFAHFRRSVANDPVK